MTTEFMLISSKRNKHLNNTPTSIMFDNCQTLSMPARQNFGLTLDCRLITHGKVSIIARSYYFDLRRLVSIRSFLTNTATATHVFAFFLRVDSYKSLLFGSTHDVLSRMQCIQIYAARISLRLPKSANIGTHVKSHYWISAMIRVTYKAD